MKDQHEGPHPRVDGHLRKVGALSFPCSCPPLRSLRVFGGAGGGPGSDAYCREARAAWLGASLECPRLFVIIIFKSSGPVDRNELVTQKASIILPTSSFVRRDPRPSAWVIPLSTSTTS